MKRLLALLLIVGSPLWAYAEFQKYDVKQLRFLDNTVQTTAGNNYYLDNVFPLPHYWDNTAFTDNLTLYGNDLIARGPWVSVRSASTLSAAHDCAVTLGRGLLIDNTVSITDNTTLSVPVWVVKGGSFSIATGKVLTINGPFSAERFTVFTGAGTIVFGPGAVPEVWAEWWGATADYNATTKTGTDNRTAFQAAINSLSSVFGTVKAAGRYYFSDDLQMVSGVNIDGSGYGDAPNTAFIAAGHLFKFTGQQDIGLSNFTVFGTDNSTGAAFHFVSGTNNVIDVDRVWVQNQYNAVYVESTATMVDVKFEKSCKFIYNRSWHVDIENLATIVRLFFNNTKFDAQNNSNNAGHFRAQGPIGQTDFHDCLFQSTSSTYSVSTAGNAYMTFRGGLFYNNANDSQGVITNGANILLGPGNAVVRMEGITLSAPKSTAVNFYHVVYAGTGSMDPLIVINEADVDLTDTAGLFKGGDSTKPINVLVSNSKFIPPASSPYDALASAGTAPRRHGNYKDASGYMILNDIVTQLTTTDASSTVIQGGQYTVQPSTNYLISYEVMAMNDNGSVYAVYRGANLFTVDANRTITNRGTLYDNTIETDAGMLVEFAAVSDGTVPAGIQLRVTGLSGTTIKWVCRVRIMALGNGTYPL